MKITLKREQNTKKEKETQENVQIDMLVKKYCAFGCPVYTVYNIQSFCVKKTTKKSCTLGRTVELFNGSRRMFTLLHNEAKT